ncbi:helix-turn-helix domain-containing protein [Cellulophaga sp. BC115SP]|nr:helix-turn-helix domain-containing protein [Cellulophaga sp. BC115SP]
MNCSQKELSEKLGLMLRTIQRIENNELKPSFYSLKVIGMT